MMAFTAAWLVSESFYRSVNILTVCQIFTHFQILVEKAQLSKDLQVVVLLPAAVQTLWVASCLPAAPPVHQPPERPQGGNGEL